MREIRGRWGLAVAAAVLLVAGCGSSGGAAQTITQTVTAAPVTAVSGNTSGGAAAGQSGAQTGAAITVVDPNAVQTAPGATPGASPKASGDATGTKAPGGSAGATPASSATAVVTATTSSTAPTTMDKAARAAARKVGTSCDALLFASDISSALGKKLAAKVLRVDDTANPDNQMTARAKCYYGTDNLAVARPLVVAIASYSDEAAAQRQLKITVQSESAAGAKASTTDANTSGQKIEILLRDGGLAIAQTGSVTVSVAVAKGVVADSALKSALTLLMRSALKHAN